MDVKDFRERANSACIVITHTPIKHLDWDADLVTSKDDITKLTAMYSHLLDGVKELRKRFLPAKNEGKVPIEDAEKKVYITLLYIMIYICAFISMFSTT